MHSAYVYCHLEWLKPNLYNNNKYISVYLSLHLAVSYLTTPCMQSHPPSCCEDTPTSILFSIPTLYLHLLQILICNYMTVWRQGSNKHVYFVHTTYIIVKLQIHSTICRYLITSYFINYSNQ